MNEKIGDIDIGNEYRDCRGIMGNCLTISGLSGQEAAESFMNGITENGNLDFNKIIPLEEKCETEREKNWGSKYNATDTQIQAEEKEQIKIMFNTSFVVFGIVKALSEKFPDLDIVYEYSDYLQIAAAYRNGGEAKNTKGAIILIKQRNRFPCFG